VRDGMVLSDRRPFSDRVELYRTFGTLSRIPSVATMTSLNSQPTSSLTELLHETEDSDPVDDRRDDR
jgi:hypothetical protein